MQISFFDRERRVLLKASRMEQEGRELWQAGANRKVTAHLSRALAYLDENVSRITQRQSDCSTIYGGLSDSLLCLGQLGESSRACDMAIQLNSDNGVAW